jgi:hypothetical protein
VIGSCDEVHQSFFYWAFWVLSKRISCCCFRMRIVDPETSILGNLYHLSANLKAFQACCDPRIAAPSARSRHLSGSVRMGAGLPTATSCLAIAPGYGRRNRRGIATRQFSSKHAPKTGMNLLCGRNGLNIARFHGTPLPNIQDLLRPRSAYPIPRCDPLGAPSEDKIELN